jgi:hypothetical protein
VKVVAGLLISVLALLDVPHHLQVLVDDCSMSMEHVPHYRAKRVHAEEVIAPAVARIATVFAITCCPAQTHDTAAGLAHVRGCCGEVIG